MTMQSGDEIAEALKKKLAAEGDEDPLPEIIKGIQSMLGNDSGDGSSPLNELVRKLQEMQQDGDGSSLLSELVKKLQEMQQGGGDDGGSLQGAIMAMLQGDDEDGDGDSLQGAIQGMLQGDDEDDDGGSLQGALQAMLQGDDEDDDGGSLQSALQGMLQAEDEDGDDSSPWGGISGGIPQDDESPPLGDLSQALEDAMQSGANDGDGLNTPQAVLQAMQDQPGDDDPSLSELAKAVKDAMETGEPRAGPTAGNANDDATDLAEKQKDLLDGLKERRPDPDAGEGGEPGGRIEIQSSDSDDPPGGLDDPPSRVESVVEVGPPPPDPGDPPPALQLRTDHVSPVADSEDESSSTEAALASVAQQGAGDAGQDAGSAATDTDGLMDAKNEVNEKLNDAAAGQGDPSLQTLTDPDDETSVLIDLRSSTSGPIRLGSDFEPHVAEDHDGGADDDGELDD